MQLTGYLVVARPESLPGPQRPLNALSPFPAVFE